MRIDFKKLRKIPVETESGVKLGYVVNIELDADRHFVIKYFVAKARNFFDNRLSVAPSQIVSVSAEKIVVEDNVCRERELAPVVQQVSGVETPAMSAEIKS